MRLGLFGGSFDPIHRGHLDPVRAARAALGLDQVIYLPTGQPPHKGARKAPAQARFVMVELALLDEPGLCAAAYELAEHRVSYTVDTVTHFGRELPEAELVYLLGGDSWAAFTSFKDWRRIVEVVELAVLVRPGFDPGKLDEPFAGLLAEGRLHFVENEPVALSSTEIRDLLARGETPPANAMPPRVLDYILKYRLYGAGDPASGETSVSNFSALEHVVDQDSSS